MRDLLSYLPQRAGDEPPHRGRPFAVPGSTRATWCPTEARKVYDVRDVIETLVDGGALLEVSERWARNMVTAFARIDGRPVGVIANQPWYLGGVIDATAAQKAAKFVRICNSFGLPLVVLVDTPGFLPGTKQEGLGVIRHGAKLLHAFSEAVVPKVTVVLRKAFGGGYITMNSKDLGADLSLAWPDAEIGIMGPKQAVGSCTAARSPRPTIRRPSATGSRPSTPTSTSRRDVAAQPGLRRRAGRAARHASPAGERARARSPRRGARQRSRQHPALMTH